MSQHLSSAFGLLSLLFKLVLWLQPSSGVWCGEAVLLLSRALAWAWRDGNCSLSCSNGLLSEFRQVMRSPSAWVSVPFTRKWQCLSFKSNTFWHLAEERYIRKVLLLSERKIQFSKQPSFPPSHMQIYIQIFRPSLVQCNFLLFILTIMIPVPLLLLEWIFHRASVAFYAY